MAWINETPFSSDRSTALGEPTGWSDVFAATLASTPQVDNSNARWVAMERAADEIIDRAEQAGIRNHGLINPMRVRRRMPQPDAFGVEEADDDPTIAFERRRLELGAQHPDIFKIDRSLAELARERARASEELVQNTLQRYGGLAPTWTAALPAGMVGSFYDPINVASLAAGPWGRVGLGSRAVLGQAVKTGAVNAAAETAIQPFVQDWRREAGLEYGLSPAAMNVAAAFGFGASLDLGIRGGFRTVVPRVGGLVPRLDAQGKVEGWMRPRPAEEVWRDRNGAEFDPDVDQSGAVVAYRARLPGRIPRQPAPARPTVDQNQTPGARLPGDPADVQPHQARPAEALTDEGARLPGAEPPEQAARRVPEDTVRRSQDGDLGALDALARETGVLDDPSVRGARQTAETQSRIPEDPSPFMDEADRADRLVQALRNGLDDSEPPARSADPVMPAREGYDRLSDDGPNPPAHYQLDRKPVSFRPVPARAIATDAGQFQFKGGTNAEGVQLREGLLGVTRWDPLAAGRVFVFERRDGTMVIADGHQRLALAKRLEATGHPPIDVNASVFREADGWAASDVRALAAKKNLQEGRADVIDAATILRERPDVLDGSVPLTGHAMRQARALSRLSEDAWGKVLRGDIAGNHAALVGDLVEARALHGGVIDALAKADPRNAREVRNIINDLLHGPREEVQEILLGGDPGRALVAERASVLDAALKLLKEDANIFALLSREASRIMELGNVLRLDANADRVLQSETVGAIVETLASRPGPVRDWLTDAAREASQAGGGKKAIKAAAETFANRVRETLQTEGVAGLAPRELPPLNGGRGVDAPGGADARAQVLELEAELQTAMAKRMREVAEKNLDRWFDWQRSNGRPVPVVDPTVRAEAIRLIAETGEDVPGALAAAREGINAERTERLTTRVEAAQKRADEVAKDAEANLAAYHADLEDFYEANGLSWDLTDADVQALARLMAEKRTAEQALAVYDRQRDLADVPKVVPGEPLSPEAVDRLVAAWSFVQLSKRLLGAGEDTKLPAELASVESELVKFGVGKAQSAEDVRAILERREARGAGAGDRAAEAEGAAGDPDGPELPGRDDPLTPPLGTDAALEKLRQDLRRRLGLPDDDNSRAALGGAPDDLAIREAAARQVMETDAWRQAAEPPADPSRITANQPGYGTPEWRQARVYVGPDGEEIKGWDAAVAHVVRRASDLGNLDTARTATADASAPPLREWFGASKVVDAKGEPLVVHHGTPFNVQDFDPAKRGRSTQAPSAREGFFFTNRRKTAEYYSLGESANAEAARKLAASARKHAESRVRHYEQAVSVRGTDADKAALAEWQAKLAEIGEPNVKDVYLSLQNPLEHDFKGKVYRDETYADLIKRAKAGGHDGLVLKNTFDAGERNRFDALMRGRIKSETIYVAFEPEQIRSAKADGTRGGGDSAVKSGTPEMSESPSAAIEQGKRAVILIGYPGAGKSTIARGLRSSLRAAHISSDDVKPLIREYENGANTYGVHTESADLAAEASLALVRDGRNVIVETLGSQPEHVQGRAQILRGAGYNTTLIHVDVPKAVAMERAVNRFEAEGRAMPAAIYDTLDAGGAYAKAKEADLFDATATIAWDEASQGWRVAEASSDDLRAALAGAGRDAGQVAGARTGRGRGDDAGADAGLGGPGGVRGLPEGVSAREQGLQRQLSALNRQLTLIDQHARRDMRETVLTGNIYDVAPDIVAATRRALTPLTDLAPDGYRVAVLEKIDPKEGGPNPRTTLTFRSATGEDTWQMAARLSDFWGTSAIHFPRTPGRDGALVFLRFGGPLPSALPQRAPLRQGLGREAVGVEPASVGVGGAEGMPVDGPVSRQPAMQPARPLVPDPAGGARPIGALAAEAIPPRLGSLDIAFDRSVRGDFLHEVLHALRTDGVLNGPVWNRLVGHAERLRIMEQSSYEFDLRTSHNPLDLSPEILAQGWHKRTLAEFYGVDEASLKGLLPGAQQADARRIRAEEGVTHLLQLVYHGALSEADAAPVRDILQMIFKRRWDEIAQGLTDLPEDALSPRKQPMFALGGGESVGVSQRRALDQLGFYSALTERMRSLKQDKWHGPDLLNTLRGSNAGVKEAEIRATGLDKFLSSKKAVTKADVVTFLEQNRVELKEAVYRNDGKGVTFGPDPDDPSTTLVADRQGTIIAEISPQGDGTLLIEGRGGNTMFAGDMDAAKNLFREARWGHLSVGGREDLTYREAVLHLPPFGPRFDPAKVEIKRNRRSVTQGSVEIFYDGQKLAGPYSDDGPIASNYMTPDAEIIESARRIFERGDVLPDGRVRVENKQGNFRDSHFPDQPNPIVNVGTSIQKDAAGKAVGLLDRFQPQWAQNIRDARRNAWATKLFGAGNSELMKRLNAEHDAALKKLSAGLDAEARKRGITDRNERDALHRTLLDEADSHGALNEEVAAYARLQQDYVLLSGKIARGSRVMFRNLSDDEKKAVSAAMSKEAKEGRRLEGVKDEAKIAELEKQLAAARRKLIEGSEQANRELDELGFKRPKGSETWTADEVLYARIDEAEQAWREANRQGDTPRIVDAETRAGKADEMRERLASAASAFERIEAELHTARGAAPGHPLVNTTDQALETGLKRVLQQFIDARVERIAISPAHVLISRGEGSNNPYGMQKFYDDILPKALLKLLRSYDPDIKGPSSEGLFSSLDGRTFTHSNDIDTEVRRYADRVGGDIDVALRTAREDRRQQTLRPETAETLAMTAHFDKIIERLEAVKAGKPLNPSVMFHTFPLTDKVKQAITEGGQPMFGLSSADIASIIGKKTFSDQLATGRRATVEAEVVNAGHDTLRPHLNLMQGLPEGYRVGFIESAEQVDADDPDFVRLVFRANDGGDVVRYASWSRYRQARALHSPDDQAILFFRFAAELDGGGPKRSPGRQLIDRDPELFGGGGDALGGIASPRHQFAESLIGEFLHELYHARRAAGLIDDATHALLVGHGQKLRVLDMDLADYLTKIGRADTAPVRNKPKLAEAYNRHYSKYPDKSDAIAEEYATHLVEMAWHGLLPREDLMPVRTALEHLFAGNDGMLARRLDAMDSGSRFALAGPRAATANLARLETAQTMLRRGRSEIEIYEATGWFRDQAGGWMFRLPDAEIQLKEGAAATARGQGRGRFTRPGPLDKLIDAPEHFAAYPDLGKATAVLQHKKTTSDRPGIAAVDQARGDVSVLAGSARQARGGFIQAVQGAIDRLEGRPMGTEPQAMAVLRQARQDIDAEAAAVVERLVALDDPRWQLGGDSAAPLDRAALLSHLQELKDLRGDLDRLDWNAAWARVASREDEGRFAIGGGDEGATRRTLTVPGLKAPVVPIAVATRTVTGTFPVASHLAWTGLPDAEFRANLSHIANKRAFKDDPRTQPGVSLATVDNVQAHIESVLAQPALALHILNHRDGASINLVRLGDDADQVVVIDLDKSDRGRLHIVTAYTQSRAKTLDRLQATAHQNGVEAVKWQKTSDGEREILHLLEQAPAQNRKSSWTELKARVAASQRARDNSRAAIGGDDDGPTWAFDEAQEDHWQGLARRGTASEVSHAYAPEHMVQGKPAPSLSQVEMIARAAASDARVAKLVKDIGSAERQMWDEGMSAAEIAEELAERFPHLAESFDPAAIAKREVWWRIDDITKQEKRRPEWPLERDAELTALVDEGLSLRELAREMGVSHTSIRERMERLGLKTQRSNADQWDTARYDDLRRHFTAGLPDKAIAAEMSISERAVSYRLGKLDLLRVAKWTPEQNTEFLRLEATGLSEPRLADEMTRITGQPVTAQQIHSRRQQGIEAGRIAKRRPMVGGAWTPERIAELTSADIAMLSGSEAAAVLNARPAFTGMPVTRNAIIAQRRRLGMSRRGLDQQLQTDLVHADLLGLPVDRMLEDNFGDTMPILEAAERAKASLIEGWKHARAGQKARKPERLVSFLVRTGGLKDEGGDLLTVLGSSKQRPGLIAKGGSALDDATLRAWEAGYLTGEQRPAINDLLAAIDEDLRGRPVFKAQDAQAAADVSDLNQLELQLERYGIAGAKSEAEAARRLDAYLQDASAHRAQAAVGEGPAAAEGSGQGRQAGAGEPAGGARGTATDVEGRALGDDGSRAALGGGELPVIPEIMMAHGKPARGLQYFPDVHGGVLHYQAASGKGMWRTVAISFSPANLAEYLGPDLAQRLLAQPLRESPNAVSKSHQITDLPKNFRLGEYLDAQREMAGKRTSRAAQQARRDAEWEAAKPDRSRSALGGGGDPIAAEMDAATRAADITETLKACKS